VTRGPEPSGGAGLFVLILVVLGTVVAVDLVSSATGAQRAQPASAAPQTDRPGAGLLTGNDGLPPSRRPVPGGRLALLHAGGDGSRGWDLLAYVSRRPRFVPYYRPFCLAIARGDARAIPRGGLPAPPDPSDLYGLTTVCQYPRTMAARLLRRGFEAHSGHNVHPEAGLEHDPYYGLVRAGVERATIRRPGGRAVEAELTEPFRLVMPKLSARTRSQIENPRQMRLTRDLPAVVELRSFLGLLDHRGTPAGQRRVPVTLTLHRSDGTRRSVRLGR
jgi:hypothetical protein